MYHKINRSKYLYIMISLLDREVVYGCKKNERQKWSILFSRRIVIMGTNKVKARDTQRERKMFLVYRTAI